MMPSMLAVKLMRPAGADRKSVMRSSCAKTVNSPRLFRCCMKWMQAKRKCSVRARIFVCRRQSNGLRILSQISYGIIQPICWVLMAKENPTLLLNALQLPFYCTMNCLMMWTLLFLMRCWHFLIHGSLPKLHSTLLLSMITTKSFPVPIWYFM